MEPSLDYSYENFLSHAKGYAEGVRKTAQKNDAIGKDDLSMALYSAVIDMTPRTLKRKGSADNLTMAALADEIREALSGDALPPYIHPLEQLAKDTPAFRPWKKQGDFDLIHHNTCEKILHKLNEYYTYSGDEDDVRYGKAQKILNMAMKNLYALKISRYDEKPEDERKRIDSYFQYCHMPLDSFTLEWCCRMLSGRAKNPKAENPKFVKKKVDSWSNLVYSDSDTQLVKGEERYTYNYYQNKIRSYFDDLKKLTPLQAEFIIWPEIQLHMAAEGFISSFRNLEKSEKAELSGKSLDEKMDEINRIIENYKSSHKSSASRENSL